MSGGFLIDQSGSMSGGQVSISPFLKSSFIPKKQNVKELDEFPVSILQLEGPLFFGSIESLMKAYANIHKHQILILDMSKVTMIDLSGAYALEDVLKSSMDKNIEVFVSNASPEIKVILEQLDVIEHIGEDSFKDSSSSISSIISEYYQNEYMIMGIPSWAFYSLLVTFLYAVIIYVLIRKYWFTRDYKEDLDE